MDVSSSTVAALLALLEVTEFRTFREVHKVNSFASENLAAGTGDAYGIQQAVQSWTGEVCEQNDDLFAIVTNKHLMSSPIREYIMF